MSSAAVTLQCPACGGVFLTLQQGTGGAEICPHCSMSAPRARYRSLEAQASTGSRTVLPPRRADQGTSSQPVPVLTAEMTPAEVPGTRQVFSSSLPPARPTTTEPVPFSAAQVSASAAPFDAGMQPPPSPPPPVMSERIPMPPVPPGELPLPSRVLQTLEPSTSVDAYGSISSLSAGITPSGYYSSAPIVAPPASPVSEPVVAAPAPPPEPPPAVVPAPAMATHDYSPVAYYTPATMKPPPPPQAQFSAPMPPTEAAVASTTQVQFQPTSQPYAPEAGTVPAAYAPPPHPTPPAYAPVPEAVPPPAAAPGPAASIDSAAAAKASPAQLWEAAILQHHQTQESATGLTGRELFTAGVAPAFQPPPPSPAPVSFGPLVDADAPEAKGTSDFAPQAAPESAPASPVPADAGIQEASSRVQAGGTVLPSARSMPVSALPPGFGTLPGGISTANPLPPPQIGFVPEAAPTAQPQPAVDLSASPFGMAVADPAASPALPAAPSLPMQEVPPHLSAHEQTTTPTPTPTLPAVEANAVAAVPLRATSQDLARVAAKMVRTSGPPPATPKSRRRAPWIAGLILGSLALAGGLHFLKERWIPQKASGDPVAAQTSATPTPEIQQAVPPQVAAKDAEKTTSPAPPAGSGQATTSTTPSALPEAATPAAEPPASVPTPVTPPPPAAPHEEVRRAMPSDMATLSISKEDPLPAIAAKLVFGIDSATTPEERARWIADPDKHSADMERLVRMRGGRLNTREVEPLPFPTPVHALPSSETVTLFRVGSPASRGGAILRLHAQNGRHLIDWPLFAQTYDNAFDRFVATNRAVPGKAEWYTVLCSLIGDPTGKNARHEPHLRLKVQGSLAETGVTEAWAEKTSPAGRYLQQEMVSGRTYLIEMQFGASDAGSRRLMVLDCAATKDETAQANANK